MAFTMRRASPFTLVVALSWICAALSDAASFVGECARDCGSFATCVVFEGDEYCAPFCAQGRCDEVTENCVVQGQACTQPPCLPVVRCEPKDTTQTPPPSFVDNELPPPSSGCTRRCPMVSAPVCGSNRVSFANACFFEQAQCMNPFLTLASHELCPEDVTFAAVYNSDSTASESSGDPVCDAIVCSTTLDPVCTSSGTMRNLCYWRKAQCGSPTIQLLYRTACDASAVVPACPTECTQEYVPVCGTNGVIYGNECLFRKARCQRGVSDLQAVDLSHCELQVGDSLGQATDVGAILASTV